MSNNRICYKCGENFYYPDGREHICTGIPAQTGFSVPITSGIAQPALTPHDIAIRRDEAPDYSAEPVSEEMKQSFPNPTCPYCGMNMKSGDGSWWCMNKTCHEQLYPYVIAQTSDWKEGPAQPPKAKPVSASEYESAGEFFNRVYKAPCALPFVPTMSILEFANRYAAERQPKRRG